jgi:hypothetical protein
MRWESGPLPSGIQIDTLVVGRWFWLWVISRPAMRHHPVLWGRLSAEGNGTRIRATIRRPIAEAAFGLLILAPMVGFVVLFASQVWWSAVFPLTLAAGFLIAVRGMRVPPSIAVDAYLRFLRTELVAAVDPGDKGAARHK